jgi:hypothetical protein
MISCSDCTWMDGKGVGEGIGLGLGRVGGIEVGGMDAGDGRTGAWVGAAPAAWQPASAVQIRLTAMRERTGNAKAFLM